MRLTLIGKLVLLLLPSLAVAERITHLQIIDARQDRVAPICCWSGVDSKSDGELLILSDHGIAFDAVLDISAESLTLTDSFDLPRGPAAGQDGERMDAEGLAVSAQGRSFVSVEGRHRVDAFDRQTLTASWPFPKSISLGDNRGFEALAIDSSDTLWAIAETSVRATTPVASLVDGAWQMRARLAQTGGYLPVGADFDADGTLYILERRFWMFRFSSRLRRVDGALSDDLVTATIWESTSGELGNLEGVAVVSDRSDPLRFLMVSDDNGMPLLTPRAVLLEP
jgi:hypothetical protein